MNTLLLLASCLAFVGCAGAAATSPTPSPTSGPALDKRFTIAVEGDKVAWTARVNTGGWKLTTDRVEVDGTTRRIFATLEKPGDGEMVGQAFQTLTGDTTSDGATSAELSVRQTRRGDSADSTYTVVAKAGA